MKPVPASTARISSAGLAMILGGRTYGDDPSQTQLDQIKGMAIPKGLDALSDTLLASSTVLALPEECTRATLYNAYGLDLQLQVRYRDAFKRTIEAAVHARADVDQQDAQKFLDRMTAEIGDITLAPTMTLNSESLSLETPELRTRLQSEFREDVEAFKQNLALWFHVLAEGNFVSVIDWFGDDALRYHFFRMESTREEVGRHEHDPGRSLFGRTVTTTIETDVEVVGERRTHTLVKAVVHDPKGYRRAVPNRIAALLDTIPSEVQPFVTIIDGMVSEEKVARSLVSKQVETETRKVWVPDPAVALFNTYVMGGWGGSSEETADSLYRDHPFNRANRWLAGSLVGTAVAAIAAEPVAGIRGAVIVGAVGLILTVFSQLGMRIDRQNQLRQS